MYHIVPYTCALWSWFKVSSVKWKSYHVGMYLLGHLLLLTCTRCGELTPRTLYRAKSTAGVASLWPAGQIRQGSPAYGLRAKYGRGRQPMACGPNTAGVANLWPAGQIRQGSPAYGLRAKYGRGRQPMACGPNTAGVANLWPAGQIRLGSPTYGVRAKCGRGCGICTQCYANCIL